MVKVLSDEEHAVLVRCSERFQHLQRDPRVLAAFEVSTPTALARVVDAEMRAIKIAQHPEDFQHDDTPIAR